MFTPGPLRAIATVRSFCELDGIARRVPSNTLTATKPVVGFTTGPLASLSRVLRHRSVRDGDTAVQSEMSVPPKMKIFAVIRTRGPAWQPAFSLEGQPEWAAHARFMNELEARGAVILGGPLEGTPDVLLVMRAGSADEAMQHLQDDPWTALNLLVVEKVMPWTVRLGTLRDAGEPR
jgi:hypothetical protein